LERRRFNSSIVMERRKTRLAPKLTI